MPIRDEAINIFMGLPGDGDRLELTYNFGVETTRSARAMATSPSPSTTSMPHSSGFPVRASSPSGLPTPSVRAARASASCVTRTVSFYH